MAKPTDDQYLDVCKHCIAYLSEKYSNEKGLFRSSVSQTDVRMLQSQVIQFSQSKFRDDPDPHLVAEVLQTSLKKLSSPLLHEVYRDIVDTDIDDDDFDISEISVQKWIVKLPEAKFCVAAALFRLLSTLAALDDTDADLIQLAYSVSPTICRPVTSAYMSIRHMEDLRKIRPVVSFIIENCEDVFVEGLEPISKDGVMTNSDSGAPNQVIYGFGSFSDKDKSDDIAAMMSSAMVIDTTMKGSMDDASVSSMDESVSSGDNKEQEHSISDSEHSPNSNRKKKPNLHVNINMNPNDQCEATDSVNPLQHFSEMEWNILEAIITMQSSQFLGLEERGPNEQYFSSPRVPRQLDGAVEPSYRPGALGLTAPSSSSSSNAVTATTRASTVEPELSSDGMVDSTLPVPSTATQPTTAAAAAVTPTTSSNATGAVAKTGTVRNRRRRMVADCKALRSQIFEFEQEWTRTHNRVPKSFERGAMESVYTRYRKLKKEIRDLAAVDIQRAGRGWCVRAMLRNSRRSQSENSALGAGRGVRPSSSSTSATEDDRKHSTGLTDTLRVSMDDTVVPMSVSSPVRRMDDGQAEEGALENTDTGDGDSTACTTQTQHTLYMKYRMLLEQKKELKRKLKKFDEDFAIKYGRVPRKSDKEVIRPMYQNYHEIKGKLDELRTTIETSHGPLPADLEDDGRASSSGMVSLPSPTMNGAPSAVGTWSPEAKRNQNSVASNGSKSYVSDDEASGDIVVDLNSAVASHQRATTGRSNNNTSVVGNRQSSGYSSANSSSSVTSLSSGSTVGGVNSVPHLGTSPPHLAGSSPVKQIAGEDDNSTGFDSAAETVPLSSEGELEALQLEKRNLHAFLKVYERDFSRLHGRPVTKHADIQPVAHEYQRYKELKAMIRDLKSKIARATK